MTPTALPTRILGPTRLEVTRLGLGLAALGRPAYITPGRRDDFPEGRSIEQMAARTDSVLDVAYEHGIRMFDAARSYGRAEGFLAAWLDRRELGPGRVFVSSKWGYKYVGNWSLDAEVHEVKTHDLETFTRQWQVTRKVLWTNMDLYQVHSLTVDSPLWADRSLLRELGLLKEEFGISVGATVTGPEQDDCIRKIIDFEHDGRRVFDTVQATYNLLESSLDDVLAAAHRSGLGIIVKEAMANGRLAPGQHEPRTAGFCAAAKTRGVANDALAIAAVLSRSWADVVLSGAVTKSQLLSNRDAFQIEWDGELEALFEQTREEPASYWSGRSKRPWA